MHLRYNSGVQNASLTSPPMKTSAQPKVTVKAGSVSLSEARAAARAARTVHYLRVVSGDPRQDAGSLWERYLGHFGGPARKASGVYSKAKSAKKGSARKLVKASAKKAGTKKRSAKKTSTKKR